MSNRVPAALHRAAATACLFAVATLPGCQDGIKRYAVAGTVLIDGQPLTHGLIRVTPSGARPASAEIDQQGRFSLVTGGVGEGVPVGTHPVR